MTELKPCPVCGNPLISITTKDYKYQVECPNCGLKTPVFWRDYDKAVEAWNQQVEENPIEAFMRKQPCDKCLFQNTPNCKIFGIGVNGEMGCSFKERVRMSELKDDSAVVLERTT